MSEVEVHIPRNEDLKQKIRELHIEKELFGDLLNIIPDGILVLDAKNRVVFQNQSLKVTLLSNEWIQGKDIDLDLCPIADAVISTSHMDFLTYHRDFEITEPEFKYLSIYCLPIQSQSSQPMRVFLVKDLTREKLRSASTEMGPTFSDGITFGAGLAHELGNPIASLSLHTHLLKKLLAKNSYEIENKDKIDVSLDVLSDELERLDLIIQNFLQAVRPTLPKFAMHHIEEVVQSVIDSQVTLAEENGVKLEYSPTTQEPFLLDSDRLKQAFMNVLINAIEASKHGGKVVIECHFESDFVEVHFEDDGEGIPPSQIAKIFEPYYTTKESGNGLGLMITYRIVKDHGGSISVKSDPQKGTHFTLTIPIRRKAVKRITGT